MISNAISFRNRISISSVCLIASLGLLRAKNPNDVVTVFRPISQDELKMTSEPLAPGAPAIILYRAVFEDDLPYDSREDDYMRIKILTNEGRKYADVEVPYVNDWIRVENLHGRTIKPDGTVTDFVGKPFIKTIAKARGFQIRAETFTLPAVEAGCVIEYYYTITGRESSAWELNEDLFTKSADFSMKPDGGNAFLSDISWTWQNMPPGGSRPNQDKDRTIRLHVANVPAFIPEEWMPPEDDVKARVEFNYEPAKVGTRSEAFWYDFGRALGRGLETDQGKPGSMDAAVAGIVGANDAPEVKLRKIYARVQQLRNVSYEKEKTAAEARREKEKPTTNVQDTWNKGYGNYFEINRVFLALARAAGFEAYEIWIPGRDQHFKFDAAKLRPLDLNDTIVLVKLNGKDTFYDPGILYTPFGSLPWVATSVVGMKIDTKNPSWIEVPASTPAQALVARHAELNVNEAGDLEGKLTVNFTGIEAARIRRVEKESDDADRKKFLEDAVKEAVASPCEITLTHQPDWTASELPLVAQFNLRVPGWAALAGHHVLIPMGLFGAQEKHLFDHTDRVYPIYITYPFGVQDEITIRLPDGWKIENLPTGWTDSGKVIEYSLTATATNGVLKISRSLNFNFILLDPKYYPALRRYLQQVKSADDEQAVVDTSRSEALK